MRLTQVLPPEVIRGTRSTGNRLTDLALKTAADAYDFTSDGIMGRARTAAERKYLDDHNVKAVFALAKRHLIEKAPTYYICRDFAEALDGMKDRDLVSDLLPDNFLAYIQFPTDFFQDAQGAWVYIGTADEKTPVDPRNRGHKIVWIGYLGNYPEPGGDGPSAGRLNFLLPSFEGKTLADVIEMYEGEIDSPEVTERHRVGRLVLNVALYIHSQDPDILDLRPVGRMTLTQQRKAAKETRGHSNTCTIPVKAINWDYKRVRHYVDAETFVDTFPRWQRCGPGFSQVKLVWVSEHLRHYKKVAEPEDK